VVLPLGISFYTFQKLAYIIDVYDGRLQPCRSLLDFSVYVAFFPQIVAGPIVRGGELLPQLAAPRRLTVELVSAGAGIFLLGFVKKAYVAEYLGQFLVDPVFAEPGAYSRLGHLLALLGYGAQVFCDFSGYSEMAIGCGRLFGIELPVNFNYPYLSKNLIEFWRRWHITLNTWLFDYIYGPLTAGQGFMRGRLDLGFVVVFLLSGLWHGARWTFVLWGAIHAVALIATRRWDVYYRGLCRRDRRYVAIRKGGPYVAAAWLLTQVTFLLSLIPFRAATIEQAWAFARGLVVSTGSLVVPEKAPFLRGPNLLLCFGFVVGYHLLEVGRGRELREGVLGLPPLVRGIACGVLIALLFLLVPISTGTFIYALF
jgi:alginate O-acetyltransferase complex protein AlgI